MQKYYFLEQLDLPVESIDIFRTPHFATKEHLTGFNMRKTLFFRFHVTTVRQ